jgi:hypothetical protein
LANLRLPPLPNLLPHASPLAPLQLQIHESLSGTKIQKKESKENQRDNPQTQHLKRHAIRRKI